VGDDGDHSVEEPLVDTSMCWVHHCDGSQRKRMNTNKYIFFTQIIRKKFNIIRKNCIISICRKEVHE
jgi:hypothetical protein